MLLNSGPKRPNFLTLLLTTLTPKYLAVNNFVSIVASAAQKQNSS
jgi:hypothetical protein